MSRKRDFHYSNLQDIFIQDIIFIDLIFPQNAQMHTELRKENISVTRFPRKCR